MNETRIEPALQGGLPFPKCFAAELLVVDRGEGVWLFDVNGNRYLDFAGGIAVNALGYGREDLAQIAAEQMRRLVHVSNLFTTEPALRLARKMVQSGPFQAVQFMNSGAEANETALKFARLYAMRRRGPQHHRLLCFSHAFHGRTMGSLSVTPVAKYQEPFQPLVPGVEVLPYNDVAALEKRLDGGFAGVIVEVVQGEGGLQAMSRPFAEALNRLCRKHDVILIADEVQTGLGRTGTFYASSGVGLEPDLITLAKPLAAGLPLAAVLVPEKINSLLHLGEHGTTFGGGPLTTAVANRVWDLLSQPTFVETVAARGALLGDALRELAGRFPFLGEVRGRGLLLGLEVTSAPADGRDPVKELLDRLRERGLLLLRAGDRFLRFAPPLVISEDEIRMGVSILERVFQEFQG